MTIDEAIETVKEIAVQPGPFSLTKYDLMQLRLFADTSLCFPGKTCLCYSGPLWLVERLENKMAWRWPVDFPAVYIYRKS